MALLPLRVFAYSSCGEFYETKRLAQLDLLSARIPQRGVNGAFNNLKKIREMFWSGRPDLNRGPPAPKVNSKMLSSCLVYVFRASYITVYGGIRRLLFPNCSQPSGFTRSSLKIPTQPLRFVPLLIPSAWHGLLRAHVQQRWRHVSTLRCFGYLVRPTYPLDLRSRTKDGA
jgi:hypothetical protein